jgi:hypothetical protein
LIRTVRSLLAAVLVTLAVVASASVAAAAQQEASGLHNARYCEIIEIKGALPDVVATVWNTIKLNRCPAAQWNSFDAGALARELGDLAVILNGPRHFLMDSATAATGPVRSFHGLAARNVASIHIRTAAELVQTPYTERTINRHNTWSWNRGRRIFELVAPGGARYLMQSYSQIRDPKLKIGQLRSLGGRLALPPGWRYRTRQLQHDLILRASGKATIIQDDLLNTYQREPRKAPVPQPSR